VNIFLKDLRSILQLGIPLVIAQLCTMAMAMTDAIIVGHGVGTEALAAMAFGLNFMNVPCIALFGLSTATSVFVASEFAAGKTGELPMILRHGIFLSFIASTVIVCLMCLIFNHLAWLNYLGQPPELIPIARPYMYFFAAAYVFTLCGANCRAFCESQNRPWLPLYVILGSIVANAVLDYVLVYGVFGLPKMGLAGAGFATLICSAGQFFVLLYIILHQDLNLKLSDLMRFEISRNYVRRQLEIGIPTTVQIGLEIASMSIVALFAGSISATTLAAHHVTCQFVAFLFMIPMGMSFAVSIRVSQSSGMNDRKLLRRICRAGIIFAVCWMAISSTILLVFHNRIPMIFTTDAEVIALSSGFLFIAGIFQVFDGIQCTAIGALRGLKDVKAPMIMILVFYWVIEIPISWTLCFKFGMGGTGIWLAILFSLIIAATFLSLRLNRMIETKTLTD
jgi:multidrug resistance protein, MATE family